MRIGGFFALLAVFLFSVNSWGLSCGRRSLEKQLKYYENVLVAEVASHKPGQTPQKAGFYTMRILKILRSGGLFKPGQKTFQFYDRNAWDKFSYKKGQLILFFFGKWLGVKCNYPIVLK